MKTYFVSYAIFAVPNLGFGNCFVKSDKTGKELVNDLITVIQQHNSEAIMLYFVEVKD